jgi:hypothetical protein
MNGPAGTRALKDSEESEKWENRDEKQELLVISAHIVKHAIESIGDRDRA